MAKSKNKFGTLPKDDFKLNAPWLHRDQYLQKPDAGWFKPWNRGQKISACRWARDLPAEQADDLAWASNPRRFGEPVLLLVFSSLFEVRLCCTVELFSETTLKEKSGCNIRCISASMRRNAVVVGRQWCIETWLKQCRAVASGREKALRTRTFRRSTTACLQKQTGAACRVLVTTNDKPCCVRSDDPVANTISGDAWPLSVLCQKMLRWPTGCSFVFIWRWQVRAMGIFSNLDQPTWTISVSTRLTPLMSADLLRWPGSR